MSPSLRLSGCLSRSLSRVLSFRGMCGFLVASWSLAACGKTVLPDESPDAGRPDAMVPGDDCVPAWQPLALMNPSFDEGAVGWLQEPADQPSIIAPDPAEQFEPHSGTSIARLGGFLPAIQELSQEVVLPAEATRIRLRGYQCFATEETDAAVIRDRLFVALHDVQTDMKIAELGQWSNGDAGPFCTWTGFDAEAPLAGDVSSVRLVFHAEADSAYLTSFNLDTLTLEAFGCPAR